MTFDEHALLDEPGQIDRVVLLEFVLDQKRHEIDIFDTPPRVLLELRSQVFGGVSLGADQREFGRLQLQPSRRPYASHQ